MTDQPIPETLEALIRARAEAEQARREAETISEERRLARRVAAINAKIDQIQGQKTLF